MKFGTVLASLSAATLLLAQPATAATRSASSLPAEGVNVTAVDARVGTTLRQSDELVGGSAILYVGLLAALVFLVLVVADEDSFDDLDELPASP